MGGSDADVVGGVPRDGGGRQLHPSGGDPQLDRTRSRSNGSLRSPVSPGGNSNVPGRTRRGYARQNSGGAEYIGGTNAAGHHHHHSQVPIHSPRPQRAQNLLPPSNLQHPGTQQQQASSDDRARGYRAEDYLDDSISAEQVQREVDRNQQIGFNAKIDTLANIFPDIERETLEIVLLSNGED